MSVHVHRLGLVLSASLAVAPAGALADCGKPHAHEKGAHAEHAHAHGEMAAEMSPEMKAMMEAWQSAMTPSEGHARLEPLAGTFEAQTTHVMKPGAPPETMTGRSENTWILGGRYLQQEYTSEFQGQPFHGHGITGYDNVRGRYVGTWIDNMGTGIMTSVGDADATGKRFTFFSEYWDAMTNRPAPVRQVMVIESPNRHRFEMYMIDQETQEEFKGMEIVYTRTDASTAAGQ